ncbi:MAG: YHYH protein [Hyphomicrobiales bacterium]|uniref:YHYH protein n=1 Tax=Nisaea sp. TaxID=2024842 RepID=UPI00326931BD
MKMFTSSQAVSGAMTLSLLTALSTFQPSAVVAHEDELHCTAVKNSVKEAGFADTVAVICEDGHAILNSNTYPDHTMMDGIIGTNEQVPVPSAGYAAPIPLLPELGDTPQTRDAALGIAVNGVPIFDYTGGGEMSLSDLYHHQTQHDTLITQQLDVCGGHAGRGDDYHYHVAPVCMIEQMENTGDAAIIGWAFDGFPIYGDKNPDGTNITDDVLDVCNGQLDETFGYRYHTSDNAPYILQCLKGKVTDIRELPRTPPLKPAQGGHGMAPGVPPRGGVENLVFTQDESGLRSMDYTYNGSAYYIRYRPTHTSNCYQFETRTVTNNGTLQTGEFCR